MLTQQLFNGLILGSTFCLVSLAFTLIVGAMDRLNFSLGETSMVSAFIGASLMAQGVIPFVLALPVAIGVGAALSVLVYFLSFRFVRNDYPSAPLLSTLGVGIMLTAIVLKIQGSNQLVVPDVAAGHRWNLNIVSVTGSQLVILLIAAALTIALYLFLERSAWGTAIRGVSDDMEMCGLLGVPIERVILVTFGIAGALAGAAGLLTGVAYHAVSPRDGFSTTLVALIVIVIGGLGSVKGAVVAALGLGMIDTLSVANLGATYREFGIYLIVAVILLVRPQGLFGRHAGILERV